MLLVADKDGGFVGSQLFPGSCPGISKQMENNPNCGEAAQIICDCVGFHRPTTDRGGGGTFLNCKSCFEWLKPDGRLLPPQVTAALTHWVTLCFWYPSSCCGFPPGPLRLGGCLICEALGSSLAVLPLQWFLEENVFWGVEHQLDVVGAEASTSCWCLAMILFLWPVVVFHFAVMCLSSVRQLSDVTAAPKKADLIYILDGIQHCVVYRLKEKK